MIIEALACGLPVSGYNVTGPRDILTKPELGAIGDNLSTATKEALKVGSAEERHKFAHNNYTWHEVAKQFLNAINETA